MRLLHPEDFDIDVDLAPLLGTVTGPALVDSRWYELAIARQGRSPALQRKVEATFRNALLRAQWSVTTQRQRERRRAARAPVLTRVWTTPGRHLTACNISLSGMRCAGIPSSGALEVEFNIPGEPFPVIARAEVVYTAAARAVPLSGLRFVSMEPVYADQLARFVARRRQKAA